MSTTTPSKTSSAVTAVKWFLEDLTNLKLPATATAIAGVIAELIPGVNISSVTLAAIIGGVGTGATLLQNFFDDQKVESFSFDAVEKELENEIEKVAATPLLAEKVLKEVESVVKDAEQVVKKARKKAAPKSTATPVVVEQPVVEPLKVAVPKPVITDKDILAEVIIKSKAATPVV